MRDSFIFYRSFYESIKELPAEQQSEVYTAVFEYSLNQNEIELSGISKAIFTLIKPQLDANLKRYANGSKGGRPKKEETKTKPKNNQKETKEKANDNENENENVNNNQNKNIKKGLEFNLPEEFNNETFLNTWNEWKQYKAKEHNFKFKSPISEAKQLNQLVNDSEKNVNLAVEMINNAIVKGWKGIYKLDNTKQNGTKQQTTKKSRDEQYSEYINSLLHRNK